MIEELKSMSACVKAIEKLDPESQERVISFLMARYSKSGRMQIKLAVEMAEIVGNQERARDVRHHVLGQILGSGVGDFGEMPSDDPTENET